MLADAVDVGTPGKKRLTALGPVAYREGQLGQLRGIWLAKALTQSLYVPCHVKFVLMPRFARVMHHQVLLLCPALVRRVLARSHRPCLPYALRQSARTSSRRSRK